MEGMNERRAVKVSKYLSKVLRHQPERAGITLDEAGWAEIGALLEGAARNGMVISRAELAHVVEHNDKRRFALSEDGTRIRASQGHTVPVDLRLAEAVPPETLFHGTTGRVVDTILTEGLRPMGRHDVHLSPDVETARRVGARRGRPVVLVVHAGRMAAEGHRFRVSDNGVWLVPEVPPRFMERYA